MTSPAAQPVPAPSSRHLPGIFLHTARTKADRAAATYRDATGVWQTLTWAEMEQRARRRAAGLVSLGIAPGDKVALLGDPSVEWVLAELAAQMVGAVSVPIYQSNPADDVRYVLHDSGSVLAFVDTGEQLEKMRAVRDRVPSLGRVVHLGGSGDGEWVLGATDLDALGEAHLVKEPASVDARVDAVDPNAPACFIYTSGTTGPPKGVVLTHANWAFQADASEALGIANENDHGLSYLPLAHSFAQVLKAVWFKLGFPTSYTKLDTLIADIGEVRPTTLASVPRIFEKVYTKVVSSGVDAPGVKGRLFRWAMAHFERYVQSRKAGETYDPLGWRLARRLVFSKIEARLKATFGGRMRFFVSGGAPLSPKIHYFFDLCGLEILEGYGLTETSAGSTLNRPGRVRIGTVGPPLPGVELEIADDGEVLIRGPNIMVGYHGQPEATKEAIDADGWLHSGDLGALDEAGSLVITGRKKDLIVTAGGKNVAPQNIEDRLKTHPLVSQVVVHGDKRKFLSALVTVDEEAVAAWATEQGVSGDYATLAKSPKLREVIQKAVDELNAALAGYETIKKFAILEQDFTQESGELTPTLKVKRRVVEEKQAALLDGFYDEKY